MIAAMLLLIFVVVVVIYPGDNFTTIHWLTSQSFRIQG